MPNGRFRLCMAWAASLESAGGQGGHARSPASGRLPSRDQSRTGSRRPRYHPGSTHRRNDAKARPSPDRSRSSGNPVAAQAIRAACRHRVVPKKEEPRPAATELAHEREIPRSARNDTTSAARCQATMATSMAGCHCLPRAGANRNPFPGSTPRGEGNAGDRGWPRVASGFLPFHDRRVQAASLQAPKRRIRRWPTLSSRTSPARHSGN